MITRVRFSVLLVVMGLIMAFLPYPTGKTLLVKPGSLLQESQKEGYVVTVDEVAGYVVREDSTIQLIDVRTADEFRYSNIPGAVNIPLSQIADKEWEGYLTRKDVRNIFYSNGDIQSNYAWVIAVGLGYKNCCTMAGGLNAWFSTVMNSKFSGETITPWENQLYETRTRAKDLFISINSLPDSLKIKFIEAKKIARKKLDGGCE